MLIAHRGIFNSVVKENSIPAFLGAINNPNYIGFELDIYTSIDGIFVVNHDPIVDNKLIYKYNYKELKQKGIVKLEDVLKLKTDKIILIEIKDINIDIDKFSKLLSRYKKKNIYVMSFFNSVLKKFQNVSFKIGLLNYVLNSTNKYSYDFIAILYDVATQHMIDSFNKSGIEVFIYGVHKKDKLDFKNTYYIVDDININ